MVTGPLGLPVTASLLVVGDTAYVESAEACGLHLVPVELRDPVRATTYGVGELVAAAVAEGVSRVVLGVGGSSTNDAGMGLLAALGATAEGAEGIDVTALLAAGASALRSVRSVDLTQARAAVAGVELVLASDVDNPLLGLRGAANGFARQKGADDGIVMELEGTLEHLVEVVGRRPDGKDPSVALGAGAAGGLGYALLHLGATRVPGIATVLETVGFDALVSDADVVVTGEGSLRLAEPARQGRLRSRRVRPRARSRLRRARRTRRGRAQGVRRHRCERRFRPRRRPAGAGPPGVGRLRPTCGAPGGTGRACGPHLGRNGLTGARRGTMVPVRLTSPGGNTTQGGPVGPHVPERPVASRRTAA